MLQMAIANESNNNSENYTQRSCFSNERAVLCEIGSNRETGKHDNMGNEDHAAKLTKYDGNLLNQQKEVIPPPETDDSGVCGTSSYNISPQQGKNNTEKLLQNCNLVNTFSCFIFFSRCPNKTQFPY